MDKTIIKQVQLGFNAEEELAPVIETVTLTVTDRGGDRVIPVSVIAGSGDAVIGNWTSNLRLETARNGTLRVLIQTKAPSRALDKGSSCCCESEEKKFNPAEITVHTVITMPKGVADRLRSTDSTDVNPALRELTCAIMMHLNDLGNALGGLKPILWAPYGQVEDVGQDYVAGARVLQAETPADTTLVDVQLTPPTNATPDKLLRFIRGSGVDFV